MNDILAQFKELQYYRIDCYQLNVYIFVKMITAKFVSLLLASLLLVYLLIAIGLYFFQHKFLFFPVRLTEDYVFEAFPNAEEVWLTEEKDQSLHGLFFKSPNEKGVVLFFHGNAGALDKWGHAANGFLDQGMSVFMIDYRGYGKSRGDINVDNFKADAMLAYQWLAAKYDPDRLHVCGRSLGTGVATWLATQRVCKTLILETPYTSLRDMAALNFSWMPLDWLMKYDLNNVDLVEESMAQTFIIHGTHDEMIPLRMAKAVAARYGKLFIIENASHNDLGSFKKYHDSLHKIFYPYD